MEQKLPQTPIERAIACGLDLYRNGRPLGNLNNAMTIIETDPVITDLFWWDPKRGIMTNRAKPRPWIKADDLMLTVYMQRNYRMRVSLKTVAAALKTYVWNMRPDTPKDPWVVKRSKPSFSNPVILRN
jgi:hypothetical protein